MRRRRRAAPPNILTPSRRPPRAEVTGDDRIGVPGPCHTAGAADDTGADLRCPRGGGPSMTATNRQLRLASRPSGLPEERNFSVFTEPVAQPGEGEFLVEVTHVSIDPAMRGWMKDVRSYMPPVGIGEVMRAGAIGRITASAHSDFAAGDWVYGGFGVQEHAVSDGRGVHRVDPDVAPLPTHLGALGATGLTAYFGLFDVGHPEPGDTVVVSGAAGAVGSVAGQLARIHGCRVIGIAGGPDKCRRLLEEL